MLENIEVVGKNIEKKSIKSTDTTQNKQNSNDSKIEPTQDIQNKNKTDNSIDTNKGNYNNEDHIAINDTAPPLNKENNINNKELPGQPPQDSVPDSSETLDEKISNTNDNKDNEQNEEKNTNTNDNKANDTDNIDNQEDNIITSQPPASEFSQQSKEDIPISSSNNRPDTKSSSNEKQILCFICSNSVSLSSADAHVKRCRNLFEDRHNDLKIKIPEKWTSLMEKIREGVTENEIKEYNEFVKECGVKKGGCTEKREKTKPGINRNKANKGKGDGDGKGKNKHSIKNTSASQMITCPICENGIWWDSLKIHINSCKEIYNKEKNVDEIIQIFLKEHPELPQNFFDSPIQEDEKEDNNGNTTKNNSENKDKKKKINKDGPTVKCPYCGRVMPVELLNGHKKLNIFKCC